MAGKTGKARRHTIGRRVGAAKAREARKRKSIELITDCNSPSLASFSTSISTNLPLPSLQNTPQTASQIFFETRKTNIESIHTPTAAPSASFVPAILTHRHPYAETSPVPSKRSRKPTAVKPLPIGRRILSVESISAAITEIVQHMKVHQHCSFAFDREVKVGIKTNLYFLSSCGLEIAILSDFGNEQYEISEGLAWGCANAPIGCNSLQLLLTCIDVPPPSWDSYKKHQDLVQSKLDDSAYLSMQKAGEEERNLAIQNQNFVNVGGVTFPWIDVIVDGGWSKRSYGHSYSSNYGVGAIIGALTKKVLFIGIRQSYCKVCKEHGKTGTTVPSHICPKNWNRPATAMEADIIREGFCNSLGDHKLVYRRFVGDGDSSVHSAVLHVYPGLSVIKYECTGHLLRNMNRMLSKISANDVRKKWNIPIDERRIKGLDTKFRSFNKLIRSLATYHNENSHNYDEDYINLYHDILNLPHHVFGGHENCKTYYCKTIGAVEADYLKVKDLIIFSAVQDALQRPAEKARSLIEKLNTNAVESFMGTVAQFIDGKRTNLGGRFLYAMKVNAAVLSYNTTQFFSANAVKLLTLKSPNPFWKKRQEAAEKRRRISGTHKHKPRKLDLRFPKGGGDHDYGDNPKAPDCTDVELSLRIDTLLNRLKVDSGQQDKIQKETIGQSDNLKWKLVRHDRITASNAGRIFCMRDTTENTSVIQMLLGKQNITSSVQMYMDYGHEHESEARAAYEELKGLPPGYVKPCGIFVDVEHSVLAASPDGLVGDDGLLEIKCPFSIQNENPNEWYKMKLSPLQCRKNEISLKKTHHHYYQIVMQLNITKRSWCDYVVWTKIGIYCTRIYQKDTIDVWTKMLPKLLRFWRQDLAPELVDPRLDRGYERCRQPEYRLLAISKKGKNKTQSGTNTETVSNQEIVSS